MSLLSIICMFKQINKDCIESGETVVPFNSDKETVDYYIQQMENLDIAPGDQLMFTSWLESLPPQLQVH